MRQVIEYVGADLSRIIEMAWEDRTPFEAIQREFGLNETAVIRLMRKNMKASFPRCHSGLLCAAV